MCNCKYGPGPLDIDHVALEDLVSGAFLDKARATRIVAQFKADADRFKYSIRSEPKEKPPKEPPSSVAIESILRKDIESASGIEERAIAVRTLVEFMDAKNLRCTIT